jgi:hypothetical protein
MSLLHKLGFFFWQVDCQIFLNYSTIYFFNLCNVKMICKHMFFNVIMPFVVLYKIKPFLACVFALVIKIGLL